MIRWCSVTLAIQPGVEVRHYQSAGPQFDFISVDGKVAVIGFLMAGGKGNVGAVVVRRRSAVEGVEAVFNSLCGESSLLFEGTSDRTEEAIHRLQEHVETVVATARTIPIG